MPSDANPEVFGVQEPRKLDFYTSQQTYIKTHLRRAFLDLLTNKGFFSYICVRIQMGKEDNEIILKED